MPRKYDVPKLKFLQQNQYNVIEMFNTGNFINMKIGNDENL